ncbi:TPA: hypothetical protein ACRRC6_004879 [Klebsiella pneumoniae]|uniref:hypothetical protein n=1 Tax=Enterobacteriaceae TaxID=543 RepID=UPI00207384F2|nr:hypothetical protein [Enterobacter bugandensis]HBQ1079191.1 hypothetical protein [Klebsiella pneumoniae]HBU9459764.1 hypothetical protein [Klebsiella pneumoniae]HBV7394880.1 hypothetical protein [Klebsiella pneumoniae]HBV7575952.1 hypothetical protein [Klebsiella pneumoniae]
MYSWNLVVITLFGGTYFPFLWFIVMRTRAKEILVKNKFYEIDPTALVPTWAKTGTQIFFYAHYCFFLVPLTMLSWLHGLAAFGAGVLMFVFTPVFFRSYLIIFRRNILQVFKKDQVAGRQLIRILNVAGWR